MKIKKSRIILLFVAITIFLIVAIMLYRHAYSHVPRDYPQIEEEGILRIVTDYNSVGYFVSADSISGYNHEMIQLLQNYTNLKLEVSLEANLLKSIEGLKHGQYDIVIRNMPTTSELKFILNFTEPIAQNRQVLVQRKEKYNNSITPIRSHLDLAKKTIHLPQNSSAIFRLKNLSHEIGDTIYYVEDPLYGKEQLAMKVASREIDYTVCDEKTARTLSKTIPEIDCETYIGFTQFEAWAVRHDSPILLDSLNGWIDKIKITSQFKKLNEKYRR